MKHFGLSVVLLFLAAAAHAELNIFTCEPEWAALANEIGGSSVNTTSATTAFQDPHYIQARPSLIANVRRADLVICSGSQLEIGWLPSLLQKANNPDVAPGTPGYFEASAFVERLNAMANVDRTQGDIHPEGNPHVQTDPYNIAIIAAELGSRLQQLDPDNAPEYARRETEFTARWRAAIADWESRLAPLRGKRVIPHHQSWVYLERWIGLEEVATLEAVPGIPPTTGHLSQLVSRFSDGNADLIIRAPYQDSRASDWLSERSGITAIVLPLTVGGTDEATDLFAWFDDIANRLLEALQ
ncbi:MAG: zinc ABC transporter substrate-binding protein [Gammaproteobacteria bacterium]|jgi:zinc/manganese transport system substrate-binding protein